MIEVDCDEVGYVGRNGTNAVLMAPGSLENRGAIRLFLLTFDSNLYAYYRQIAIASINFTRCLQEVVRTGMQYIFIGLYTRTPKYTVAPKLAITINRPV